MSILPERLEKIANLPTPLNPTGFRAFLGSIDITHKWIKNYKTVKQTYRKGWLTVKWPGKAIL